MERYKLYFRHIIPPFLIVLEIIFFIIYYANLTYYEYEYSSIYDGYIITEYHGSDKILDIPSSYNNKPVVEIGVRAFFENDDIEEVILPESIKSIDKLAFSKCINLKSINLDNVEYIGNNAFSYCNLLDNIKIKVSNILGSTFYKCNNLSNIVIEEGVKTIGSLAFSYTNIEELYLPHSFIKIYDEGFLYSATKKIYAYNDLDSIDGIEIIKRV